jgi:hypothetical protein
MAFFRSYLLANQQQPDTTYDERDEAALILFLLESRLRRSAIDLRVPDGFTLPERMPREYAQPDVQRQLKFVAGFVCFFVAKPIGYLREMQAFRSYFIPGFADDAAKQIQLAQALRPSFFTATLEDLQSAETLDSFFDIAAISTAAAQ